jgi:hypothetical protein
MLPDRRRSDDVELVRDEVARLDNAQHCPFSDTPLIVNDDIEK